MSRMRSACFALLLLVTSRSRVVESSSDEDVSGKAPRTLKKNGPKAKSSAQEDHYNAGFVHLRELLDEEECLSSAGLAWARDSYLNSRSEEFCDAAGGFPLLVPYCCGPARHLACCPKKVVDLDVLEESCFKVENSLSTTLSDRPFLGLRVRNGQSKRMPSLGYFCPQEGPVPPPTMPPTTSPRCDRRVRTE